MTQRSRSWFRRRRKEVRNKRRRRLQIERMDIRRLWAADVSLTVDNDLQIVDSAGSKRRADDHDDVKRVRHRRHGRKPSDDRHPGRIG